MPVITVNAKEMWPRCRRLLARWFICSWRGHGPHGTRTSWNTTLGTRTDSSICGRCKVIFDTCMTTPHEATVTRYLDEIDGRLKTVEQELRRLTDTADRIARMVGSDAALPAAKEL